MARVDKISPIAKQPEYYSDLDINMTRNLITGELLRLTNDEAIKQALVTLILTSLSERPYQPWVGSNINSSLFGLADDPLTLEQIKTSIRECINNNEPRVNVEDIQIFDDIDNNGYNVRIVFSSINIQRLEAVDIFISRIR